jgi:CP family cyanate transporter-like MFS transporter
MIPAPRADHAATSSLLPPILLLWLAGMGMRVTILAVPPVIPLIREELGMSETEVGLLIGLPLVMWAAAAVPGSLLIARLGAAATLVVGLLLTALSAGARGAAPNVWLLYLATTAMGCGIAIMQPAMPTLVREWLPQRIGLGTAATSNGMLVGVMLGPTLTIPLVLPLLGGSWRLDLVLWAGVPFVAALLCLALAPRARAPEPGDGAALWWPDWKNPLIWLLGLTFGSNNALFYGANAFLPDYLVSTGRADLTGPALGWMAGSQLIASTALLATAERLQRRAWPFALFGAGTLASVLAVVATDGLWLVVSAAALGFTLAVTFVITFALPAALSPPGEVHRVSAGMFTVSYGCAVVVPVVCGALWDLTGRPWAAFVPLALCALTLTAIGVALARHRPMTE